jgi:hypothetical protein
MPPLAAAVYCFPPRHDAPRDADATRAITRDDIIARCAAITPFAAMLTPTLLRAMMPHPMPMPRRYAPPWRRARFAIRFLFAASMLMFYAV